MFAQCVGVIDNTLRAVGILANMTASLLLRIRIVLAEDRFAELVLAHLETAPWVRLIADFQADM